MEIYLIRHTKPLVEKGICYGQSDIDVRNTFDIEAEKLIQWLPQELDILYSSPLLRCIKLSEKIQESFINKPKIIHDKRLIEMNFGDWELKKWDELDRKLSEQWIENILVQPTPNGESFYDLNLRVTHFINDILNKKIKKAGVVTHAGVIRCFISRFKNISLIETLKLTIDFASLTILRSDSVK